jgi:hypothetical protein
MNAKWKRLFIWSSIGSVALGATIGLAKKTRKRQEPPLVLKRIPADCTCLSIWTEQTQVFEGGQLLSVRDKYILQTTQFKVWSVLDPSPGLKEGAVVFHTAYLRSYERGAGDAVTEEAILKERFYGTIAAIAADGRSCGRNSIARGALLEIRKCNVGGSNNGVETGEVHRSVAPILNYRFEYTPL